MRRIRVMAPDLAMKIAAGEVVERPSSVVKELIDNAIDAGASAIAVEILEGGLKLIRVTDDGHGIPRDDLPLAFESHATSKIENVEDFENLSTLGFRGEALSAIAAVARVEVVTRTADESIGSRYSVTYGEAGACTGVATPHGLRASVRDLFYNVPARRKFVRSQRAEGAHAAGVVMQYALAKPAIQFTLSVDGRQTFMSPGGGRLSEAVAAVYGADVLDLMLPLAPADGATGVSGLISRPQLSRQNRSALHFFVNGRPISNRGLGFALEEAYSGFLMTGRHPVAIIHLRVDPGDVDVNAHPAKSIVRFSNEREVHGIVHRSVSSTLVEMRVESRALSGEFEAPPVDEPPSGRPLPLVVEDDGEPALVSAAMPALRVFGQANQTFIVAEGPHGLYMIDQHAAHERILFDRFEEEMTRGPVASQPLLEPAAITLTPGQIQALEENGDLLASLGFTLEPFGSGACLVRAVPALPRGGAPIDAATEVLDELSDNLEPSAARERALASLACRAAVKAGQTLDTHEMREIVFQLERTARPSTCPHGRPTMIHLSNSQLEREFGRR